MPAVNIWAVVAATVASQLLGFVWYSVLFGKQWAVGYRLEADALASTPPVSYAATVVGALVYSLALAVIAGVAGVAGIAGGIALGALVWIGLVVPRYLLHALFGRFAGGSVLIDLGFDALVSLVAGAIIGGWMPR